MDPFHYKNGQMYCESISVSDLVQKFGSPLYIYSKNKIKENADALKSAFKSYPTLPCFAVKANSNLSILKTVFNKGFGADIVSVGELERCLLAKAKCSEIVYSSIGKREDEIRRALEVGIYALNVESVGELKLIDVVAKSLGVIAPVSLRINPDIDAKTHPYIATGLYTTKFGVAETELKKVIPVLKELSHLELIGLSTHIGSQITSLSAFKSAGKRMREIAKWFQSLGFKLQFLDLGGGLAVSYDGKKVPTFKQYADTLIKEVKPSGLRLLIEPGRCIVANSGILATSVLGLKTTPKKHFVVVDAAMNDLIRPMLYEAYHVILPVQKKRGSLISSSIVGPICETGDCFGEKRKLPKMNEGELLAIQTVGAYGFTMASHYNTRPHPAEILVDGTSVRLIRPRESLKSLWESELPGA